MKTLSIVAATPRTEVDFFAHTWLGESLLRLQATGLDLSLHLFFENRNGLSQVYNHALTQVIANAPVLFVHDDVSLQDLYLVEKLTLALQQFDLVGVAGGTPPPGHCPPSWFSPEYELSGFIAHGAQPNRSALQPKMLDYFGPSPQPCRFVDGMFLATVPQRLLNAGVRFDPQFQFDHYDLDLCLMAQQQGLRVGTWPIWIAHGSTGQHESPASQVSAQRFLQKHHKSLPSLQNSTNLSQPSSARPETLALIQQAVQLKQAGQLEAALNYYQMAIKQDPSLPEVWFNLGNLLQRLGQEREAESAYEQAVTLKDDLYQAHLNWGNLLRDRGEVEAAVDHYRRTIAIKPDLSLAYKNLGELLINQKRLQEAAEVFTVWGKLEPDNLGPLNGLGIVYQALGAHDKALQIFEQALEKAPHRFDTLNNLGTLLRFLHRPHEALAYLKEATQVEPTSDLARSNLVHTLLNLGQVGEALLQTEQLLEKSPLSASGYLMKGFAHTQLSQTQAALDCFQRCYDLDPGAELAVSNALFTLLYDGERKGQLFVKERQKWVERLPPVPKLYSHWKGDHQKHRRLKVGYLSGDLRAHPVAFFLEPILAHHDPKQVEITCYDVAGVEDNITARLQGYAHHWRTAASWSDAALAQKIHEDAIDILIDLCGHTSGNRMGVLRAKPAPIQMLYIGYPGSTGLKTVDYILSDVEVSPAEYADLYQEQVLRVEGSFWCFQPHPTAPEPGPLPALKNGYITFGSFNNSPKLSPATLQLWSQLLLAIPTARLRLKALALGDPQSCEYFREQFAQFGADLDRIEFEGPTFKLENFFESYHQIDIALDPTPYNGGTTTCEALWMGVPVITLRGDRFCSRMSHSFLKQLGLSELSTATEERYIQAAIELGQDLERLRSLRMELRARMAALPICDGERAAYELEKAFQWAWQQYSC